ncbi:YceI family protein [Fulvivirga sp. RKSG066]|uniref:YceI family protein n=1 Tax=Fulvivirga aurantia TaxID=2529383 RepID=UPI0012BC29BB|nr:YceI family protein [Fulvivirga aurantia]MTI23049.1 YceI family protein [Fulvivirga aurantia]
MINHKLLVCAILFLASYTTLSAQKYKSSSSTITFFSEAPLENIDATTSEASSIFDESTSEIVFSVPINTFEFDKSLMQEHFNENYLESEKYPKATFSGKIYGYDHTSTGQQQVTAKGEMTIHGETQQVEITGTLQKSDQIEINSKFMVTLEDYKIKIPKVLWKNIAEEVEVTVNFIYEKL